MLWCRIAGDLPYLCHLLPDSHHPEDTQAALQVLQGVLELSGARDDEHGDRDNCDVRHEDDSRQDGHDSSQGERIRSVFTGIFYAA